MRFNVSSQVSYTVNGPSTLILNVHAWRNGAQMIQEESFVVEPKVKCEEFVLDQGQNRFVRIETGTAKELKVTYRATVDTQMATLLMEGCRALGIAARFSSGYLDCAASLAGRASTHAWAEAYLAGRGWTGFDPTLGEQTNGQHIAIGLSNHPRGVMPISGRFYGTSADYIGMTVAVKFETLQPSAIEAAS